MGPEGSLSCSQEPCTCPYPEPDKSNPYFLKVRYNKTRPPTYGSSYRPYPFCLHLPPPPYHATFVLLALSTSSSLAWLILVTLENWRIHVTVFANLVSLLFTLVQRMKWCLTFYQLYTTNVSDPYQTRRIPSSGMWLRMVLVKIYTSEECIASNIRMKRINDLVKTLTATINWSTLRSRSSQRASVASCC
jgi:hypothetical protein